ncbi:hypothetical protein HAX54_024737 [Datura stramonium]|uniref:Uncharacterized protein n=1 Tax=Datura stramonium TaxID=4076 RepID=A0ABS8RKK0_DATST|nr:hypothetical protein [Datura stramonium]
MKSPSAGVIDEYSVGLIKDHRSLFMIVPATVSGLWNWWPQAIIFSDFQLGVSIFALYVKTAITVWHLKSNIRNRDALWVRKYVTNVATILPFGLTGSPYIEVQNMDIHPAIPHIFYLDVKDLDIDNNYYGLGIFGAAIS